MFTEQSVFELLENQQKCWPEYAERIKQLEAIQTKTFQVSATTVIAQINPARIVSSGAKVDMKSIKSRKCFLCATNRPEQQLGLEIIPNFTLLVNPFPILKGHLTIPSNNHCIQTILPNIGHMIEIAEMLPSFSVFYNGPKCGASAPDHLHFQAVLKGQLPFNKEVCSSETLAMTATAKMVERKDLGRKCISIEGDSASAAIEMFYKIYKSLPQKEGEEPMMNVFAEYDKDAHLYHINIFCRKAHRPSQYFSDEDFWMISPGAIDMAGVFVLPRLEDFERIDKNVIIDVYNQVSL